MTRWHGSPRAIHTRTPRGGVVLDPVRKAYFVLNPSGEILWSRLRAGASRDELALALVEEFEVSQETAGADADIWLGEMLALGLVEAVDVEAPR